MLRFRSILLFAACTTLVCADLKSDLSMAGILAVFPGEPDYDHASVSRMAISPLFDTFVVINYFTRIHSQ